MVLLYVVLIFSVLNTIAILLILFVQAKHLGGLKEKLTSILLEAVKENQKQIEKNSILFNELSKATSKLNDTLKDELYNRFKDISAKFDDVSFRVNNSIEKQISQNRDDMQKFIGIVEQRLIQISEKVDSRLKSGFENVDRTFRSIIEGIARISEAQRKIEELSGEVVSLQKVLDDKKNRGVFGEVRLETILQSVFGPKRELYDVQYTLESEHGKVVVDAVIKAPQIGLLAVDSKFPLENYIKMINANESDKVRYEGLFKQNLKKHIDDISKKYIVKGTTTDMAVMFLPAEAIFAYVNAYEGDVIEYARAKKVWIASPTTLMALLTTIQAIVIDIKTQDQAKRIQEELVRLSKNFSLYRQRWERLIRDVERLHKDAHEVNTTTQKISKAFERIEKVELEEVKGIE